jgi:DNA-binding transcriptional LysR family regulator
MVLLTEIMSIWNERNPMPWDKRVKRRLKLRDLDILVAVARAGTMGKAAVSLNMTQSAVSKSIAELEQTLGVSLLNRFQRGVELTPCGSVLVSRGVAVFDELRQGVQDIDFLVDPTAGELRIATTDHIAAAIVVPAIRKLNREHPGMTFHVVSGTSAPSLYRFIDERDAEFVISRIPDSPPETYAVETLFNDSLVVVAGANNPLTRRRTIELADLLDQPWTVLFDSYSFSFVEEAFRASGLPLPRLAVRTSSVILRNEMLVSGEYLGILPSFSLSLPRKHASLKALPVKLPRMHHPVAIITLKHRSLSARAQLFVDRVRTMTKPLREVTQRA